MLHPFGVTNVFAYILLQPETLFSGRDKFMFKHRDTVSNKKSKQNIAESYFFLGFSQHSGA
jgi:hypothetical protein